MIARPDLIPSLYGPVALLLVIFLSACAPASIATPSPMPTPGTFINPVLDQDFPDPDILKVGDVYYAYATNGNDTNIQAVRSTDLVHWQVLEDALPELPDWAVQEFGWAW